jgi:murein L,D-transpeptidase YcbB/YkuD
MKAVITAFLICCSISFSACKYFDNKDKAAETDNTPEEFAFSDQFPLQRDSSINNSNAYNNMFLDPAAIEGYVTKSNLTPHDVQAIKGFYNLRNYQYSWFAKDGLTEQGRAFWNAYTYAKSHGQKSVASDKALTARMDTILNIDTLMIADSDTSFLNTEVALTQRFIQYYNESDPQSLIHRLPLTQLLPARKEDAVVMADSVLHYNTDSTATDSVNVPFLALKEQLAFYDSIAKAGGWPFIDARVSVLKKGMSSPMITGIKRRLHTTKDLRGRDTSAKFTDSLEVAIKSYQERNGFEPDGIITDSIIAVMNVPVNERIKQILVNMNRMAWLPPQIKDNFVSVNIPSFMLEVYEGDSIPVQMEVVVGKEGTNTMMFTGDLNQVVFSPIWHLPASIVEKEVLPAIEMDPNYLKKKNMVIVRRNDSLPEIQQLPGPGNGVGKVKFLFPNSYDIYLHDTEAKELFQNKVRAFSHGCIRLADAEKMSAYVLRNNSNWTSAKIRTAMNSNKEQSVEVKSPILS